MGVVLIQEPKKYVGTSTKYSRVNNIHQPIYFIFRREDGVIDSVTNDGGNAKITTNDDFVLSDIPIGSKVKIVSDVYNGIYEVLDSNPPTEFTLDLTYSSDAIGYVNFYGRENWYLNIEVKIKTIDDYLIAGFLNLREDKDDLIKVNVAPLLKSYALMNDKFNYSDFCFADEYESNYFDVWKLEKYKGSDLSATKVNSVDFYWVNSINQPRYRSGANMEYFMLGNTVGNLIKWLTPFKRPTAWKNFPFCMSFLNWQLSKYDVFQWENYGGAVTETEVDSDQNFLTRTLIADLNDSTTDTVDVKLRTFVESTYYDLSETITVDIDQNCNPNPVYLNWLDTSGGRAFWLFNRIQTVGIETAVGDVFEPLVEDLATQQGDIFEVERQAGNRLVLTTYTTIEKMKGIKSMLYSLNVLMLVNPETWQDDGVIWEAVRPLAGSFQLYNTNETHTNLTVTIELMNTNIQSR
jgi:hypothetical protein